MRHISRFPLTAFALAVSALSTRRIDDVPTIRGLCFVDDGTDPAAGAGGEVKSVDQAVAVAEGGDAVKTGEQVAADTEIKPNDPALVVEPTVAVAGNTNDPAPGAGTPDPDAVEETVDPAAANTPGNTDDPAGSGTPDANLADEVNIDPAASGGIIDEVKIADAAGLASSDDVVAEAHLATSDDKIADPAAVDKKDDTDPAGAMKMGA